MFFVICMPQLKFKLYENSYFLRASAKHCSWKTLDPYSDFINWAAEKIDSTHTSFSKYTQKMYLMKEWGFFLAKY